MAFDDRKQGRPGSQSRQERAEITPVPQFTHIKLARPLHPELFNATALQAAREVACNKDRNKPTQLRRFYDELVSWENRLSQFVGQLTGSHEERTRQAEEKFREFLPFIRMLNAKAAYAEGRKLVDNVFVALLHQTLAEVKDPETLTACKHFWEAFMGFYKQERPQD